MNALLLAALVGIVHVHHVPSHDSEASFEEVLSAASATGLDFVILTEHVPDTAVSGPLPAAERAGLYLGDVGEPILVLVGAEFGSRDGHVVGLGLDRVVPAEERPGADVVRAIREAGGFAVVTHPFAYGGWHAWDADFTGLEVHNNAAAFRRLLGPLLPFRLLLAGFDRERLARRMLVRPERELEKLDALLAAGRPVIPFSGADAHQNVRLFGRTLDPYGFVFRLVQTHCPEGPLTADWILDALREGRCWIRYTLFDDEADAAELVRFPTGRTELQLDGGRRVLEIRAPGRDAGASALSSGP